MTADEQMKDLTPDYLPILDWPTFDVWLANISAAALTAFDTETTSLDPMAAMLVGMSFAVEPGEACSLADASADAACVAQALHWFELPRFFAECERVLRPGGVLVAWGYQDIELDADIADANAALQARIRDDWPPERRFIDEGYASFDFPFEPIAAPAFELRAEWTLPRLLGYFSSYSASKRHRERRGEDPVALHAEALAAAWGDPLRERTVRWPLFVHARRKPAAAAAPGCAKRD